MYIYNNDYLCVLYYIGYGIMYYKSGDKYEGEFKHDLREGKGIMTWINGEIYNGTWYDLICVCYICLFMRTYMYSIYINMYIYVYINKKLGR